MKDIMPVIAQNQDFIYKQKVYNIRVVNRLYQCDLQELVYE